MFIKTNTLELINVKSINLIIQKKDTIDMHGSQYDRTRFVAHLDTGEKVIIHSILTPSINNYPYCKHRSELTDYMTLLEKALAKHNLIINI